MCATLKKKKDESFRAIRQSLETRWGKENNAVNIPHGRVSETFGMCIICGAFCQQLHACYSCPPPSQSTFYKLYNILTLILQDKLSQPHMIHKPRHSQEPGPQTSCPTSTVSENANGGTSFMALPMVFQRFPGIWTTNLHFQPETCIQDLWGTFGPLISLLTLFLLRQFSLTFPTQGFSLGWPTLKTSSNN